MGLSIGTRLGVYEVIAAIGSGGMGDVYRARDTTLGRDVALKVLSDRFADDLEHRARFEREAHALAALNHPNIATIHGFEGSQARPVLVMELVEGPTLADRIARGPLPVQDAVAVALQIAEALAVAHEHGIVHRDLKPSNIKLRADRGVKVLDFGLAKFMDAARVPAGAEERSTMLTAQTSEGLVLGTVAYMSPEQAAGLPVDTRADIWAFGCVLYEMLTGRPAFAQDSIAKTVARIIEGEPDWQALPSGMPPMLPWLLRKSLEKDPRRRLHAAADARIAIEDLTVDKGRAVRAGTGRKGVTTAWAVALLAVVAAMAFGWSATRRSAPAPPPLRLDVNTVPTDDPTSFALSPDGRHLVFVALDRGVPRLWLRNLAEDAAQPLTETEGAVYPFWAPGGRAIGFFADGLLKRIDLDGGRPRILAYARNPQGGSWSRDDQILYSPAGPSPLMLVPATGGQPTVVTHLATAEVSHRNPVFLPDGRRFLFLVVAAAPEDEGVYLASLDRPDTRRRLLAGDMGADYSDGYVLTLRQGALIAAPFDAGTGTVSGETITIAPRVSSEQERGAFSASAGGLLAYRNGGPADPMGGPLVWTDRNGHVTATLPLQGFPSLTPDGRHVAVSRRMPVRSNTDIWLIDTARAVPRSFTFDPAFDVNAVWSPDGLRVAFASNRSGVFNIFEKPVAASQDERLLLESPANKFPVDWSPDGETLLFINEDSANRDDLWTLPLRDPSKAGPWLREAHTNSQGQFSPDGRWLAYRSNESGRWQIYVRPYPGPGTRYLISPDGGIQPRWRRDGKELFYIAADSQLMAVSIDLPAKGEAIRWHPPVPLFTASLGIPKNQQFGYAVDPSGQRFLIMSPKPDHIVSAPITIVQNWPAGLRNKH